MQTDRWRRFFQPASRLEWFLVSVGIALVVIGVLTEKVFLLVAIGWLAATSVEIIVTYVGNLKG